MASCATNGVNSPGAEHFATTRWSLVTAAADQDSSSATPALERLCRAYWYPLYAYVRRKGLTAHDAQDLIQEFFYRLIEKNYLTSVDRSIGTFRCFLLASLNHLLANEWDKTRALKRGGGREIISLDRERAEGRFLEEPLVESSAERAFDRGWTLILLDRALSQLRDEWASGGKLRQFDILKPYLSDAADNGDYAALGERLGIKASTIGVAVHRLRQRYREIVRSEIAQTVRSEEELNTEMRHLLQSLD